MTKQKPKTNGTPAPITKPDAKKKSAAARMIDPHDKTAAVTDRAMMKHEKGSRELFQVSDAMKASLFHK